MDGLRHAFLNTIIETADCHLESAEKVEFSAERDVLREDGFCLMKNKSVITLKGL